MGSLVSKKISRVLLVAVVALVVCGLLSPPSLAAGDLEQRKIQLLELLGLNPQDPAVISASQQAHTLFGIDVVPAEDNLSVILHLSGLPEYDSYLYQQDKRLVVDLKNTINLSPSSLYSFSEKDPIRHVRNSQYRVSPSFVARVVLVLERNEMPQIKSDGNSIIITAPLASPETPEAEPAGASEAADPRISEVIPVPAMQVDTAAPKVDLLLAQAQETVPPAEPEQNVIPTPVDQLETAPEEIVEAALEEEELAEETAEAQEIAQVAEAALEMPAEEEMMLPAPMAEEAVVASEEAAGEAQAVIEADAEAAPIEPAAAEAVAASEEMIVEAQEAAETPAAEAAEEAVAEVEPQQAAMPEPAAAEKGALEISVEPKEQLVEVPLEKIDTAKTVKAKPAVAQAPAPAQAPAQAGAPGNGVVSSGNLVTLTFRDADLSAVLDILARKGNLNILAGKDVKGRVTVRLIDVPFDVALNAVLNVNGFGYIKSDNIVRVVPLSQLGAPVDTRTETFTLSYAEAKKVKTTLQGMMSPHGKIDVDERTNMLIVTDVPINIERIRELIPQIDRRVQQVLIEVLILDSVLTDEADLGITWNLIDSDDNSPGFEREGFATANDTFGVLLPKAIGGLDVNIGTMIDGLNLQVLIQALVDNTDSRILANPKILTIDNESASIEIVAEFPYNDVTQTSSGGQLSNITFKEIGTKLEVKPQITHDEHVILWITPEQNSIADVTITGVPIVDTRRAETTLIVRNHQTIVIGGLRENRKITNISKVPFLGDLPGIKYAFRSVGSDDQDTELLVFLTVHIVESPPLLPSDEIKFDELANMPRKTSTSINLVR